MPKKAYIGVGKLTNLIPNSSFETNTGWYGVVYDTSQKKFGNQSCNLQTSTTPKSVTIAPPILGHKYYGRTYVKSSGEISATDNRFELYGGDGLGKNWIFAQYNGNYPDWTMKSSIQTITAINATTFYIRSFALSAKSPCWVDGLMLIDLTACFGTGFEPTKEWCDANIPYFDGQFDFPAARNGVARSIKKMYIGVANKARKVKKAYVGVNGVARPFFTSEQKPVRYGALTYFSTGQVDYSSTATTTYVLFFGGVDDRLDSPGKMEFYDRNLVHDYDSTSALKQVGLATAIDPNGQGVAIIAGGRTHNGDVYKYVTGLDESKVRLFSGTTLTTAAEELAACNLGKYALFAGGSIGQGFNYQVDAVSYNGTKTRLTDLEINRENSGAELVGNYAVVAGGYYGSSYRGSTGIVEAYSTSLTKATNPSPLQPSNGRYKPASASVNGRAIFAGGSTKDRAAAHTWPTSNVEAYNSNLTKTTATSLRTTKTYLAGTHLGEYAIFGGGERWDRGSDAYPTATVYVNTVDYYDKNLVRTDGPNLGMAGSQIEAETIGNFAIFGGRMTELGTNIYVEAYTI